MIKKNNTWELVDKPEEKDIIGLKWVYTVKSMKMAPSENTSHVSLQKVTLSNQELTSLRHMLQ